VENFIFERREYCALLFCFITSYYFQREHILAKKKEKKYLFAFVPFTGTLSPEKFKKKIFVSPKFYGVR
jgi:hypothetical protein